MEKVTIRRIAMMLVLMNMLSGDIVDAKANDSDELYYYLDKNGILRTVDSREALESQGLTIIEDQEYISIFNQKNTYSQQYGGNQRVFKEDFKVTIKNPYVWEELQNYFPVSTFSSEEEAMDFYELYLTTLAKSGCLYVAITTKVFHEFEGKEDEFEEIFGFPMYTINNDNSIDFNYEVFTLKFFNFYALYPNYNEERKQQIRNMYTKTLAYRELNRFMNSDEYNIPKKNWLKLEGEEQREYIKAATAKKAKYKELYEKWEKARNETMSLSLTASEELGHFNEFLATYGLTTSVEIIEDAKNMMEPGDIIGSDHFDLYKEKTSGKKYSQNNDINPHAVYVVSVDDGKVIVSSWGDRYIFDDTDANWTIIIRLDIKRKNKTKTR